MTGLDPFEKSIIRELQRDASLTTAELAERVGLSPSPCWRRIDRLERDGYIKGRVAVVDRRKVGLHAHIFAQVKLNAHGRANLDEFSAAIAAFPEVLGAYVLEYGAVGLIAGVTGVGLGALAAWPVVTQVFKADWAVDWSGVAALVLGAALLAALGGLLASLHALAKRPAAALRAE